MLACGLAPLLQQLQGTMVKCRRTCFPLPFLPPVHHPALTPRRVPPGAPLPPRLQLFPVVGASCGTVTPADRAECCAQKVVENKADDFCNSLSPSPSPSPAEPSPAPQPLSPAAAPTPEPLSPGPIDLAPVPAIDTLPPVAAPTAAPTPELAPVSAPAPAPIPQESAGAQSVASPPPPPSAAANKQLLPSLLFCLLAGVLGLALLLA